MDTPTMFYGIDQPTNHTDAFSDHAGMLSGGMVWKIAGEFRFTVPECESLFIDSGGFQATSSWDMEFPYEPKELFDWAESIDADLVACPDFACEPELHETSVMDRIHRTVEEHALAYAQYKDGDYTFELVPVLQGYEPEQYRRCIELYEREGFIEDYMAIGTVCKRDSVDSIHRVLETLERHLPDTEWHMFGMTLNAWKDRRLWGRFKSADTAAWNWGGQTQAHKVELLKEYSRKVNQIREQMQHQTTL